MQISSLYGDFWGCYKKYGYYSSSEGFWGIENYNNLASTKDAMSFWVNNKEICKNLACIKDLMIFQPTTKNVTNTNF